ncbi:MAG: AraC family transcriptional regulator [Lentisphaeria bacterium]|nr:AraC family transcriptional regulator [Lentisphaeria bacterium]
MQHNEKKLIDYSRGDSKLVGVNIGRYPSHHFVVLPEPFENQRTPLCVTNCGFDLMSAGVSRRRANCDVCSFELVNEGEIVYETGGTVYRCRPGDIFVMHMHSNNRLECVSPLAKVSCVGFNGSLLNEILTDLHLHKVDYLRLNYPQPFFEKYDLISRMAAQSHPDQLTDIAAEGYRLLLMISSEIRYRSRIPPLLREIVSLFKSHLCDRIRMENIAKKYNISQSSLFSMFRRHIGLTPAEYLTQLRIQYAKRLLPGSEFSVKEIASMCGYDNQMYFSRVFRSRCGVSPTEFRRIVSSNDNPDTSSGRSDRSLAVERNGEISSLL